MKVTVLRAWPRRFEQVELELPDGARVVDALVATGWQDDVEVTGHAIHGLRITPDAMLRDGDRVECLRPLVADPKDARRRRADLRPLKARPKPR